MMYNYNVLLKEMEKKQNTIAERKRKYLQRGSKLNYLDSLSPPKKNTVFKTALPKTANQRNREMKLFSRSQSFSLAKKEKKSANKLIINVKNKVVPSIKALTIATTSRSNQLTSRSARSKGSSSSRKQTPFMIRKNLETMYFKRIKRNQQREERKDFNEIILNSFRSVSPVDTCHSTMIHSPPPKKRKFRPLFFESRNNSNVKLRLSLNITKFDKFEKS